MSQFFEYTDSGIRFKGFQDLRQTLVDAWKATFGEGLDTTPTSPDGHHIDLEAATVNSIAEMLQAVANTMSRNQATGQYLDLLAALLGLSRNEGETDAELRVRMDTADTSGLATYDGMLTYLRNALGSSIGLKENYEPTTDSDGIPGHSFRLVVPDSVYSAIERMVESGEIANADDFIAQQVWNCKPGGIKPDGNNIGIATDKSWMKHSVKFSRPTNVDIDVQVVLSLYSEETFPVGGEYVVREAIVAWSIGASPWASAEYTPGKDVIPERLYTPILTIPGISSALIKVRKTGETEWQSGNIAISSQELAVLQNVDVSVSGAT